MSDPRGWLHSRHLARSAGGKAALAMLDSLEPQRRDAILASADDLATASVTMAHGYFTGAVTLASRSPAAIAARAAEWERAGRRILATDEAGRAVAQAWFSLDAERLCTAPDDARDALVDGSCRLSAGSRRLAAAFIETMGTALCEGGLEAGPAPADGSRAAAVIVAWNQACENTLRRSRWRGEFLASRLLETASRLCGDLAPASVAAWGEVLSQIGAAGRGARCPDPPLAIARLPAHRQLVTLELCARLAAHDPRAGERALESLPAVLAAMAGSSDDCADAFLDAAAAAVADAGLVDALSVVAAEAHALPTAALTFLTAAASDIARRFPAGVVPYLRVMDRAFELGGEDGVRLWVERGCEIGVHNPEAGIAHFRLQSRTANKVLVEHSTAVALDEYEPVLQRYLVMMARRSLHIASGGGVWLRPPIAAPEDHLVRLPESIDLWDTTEENQSFYKLAVAHAAGRWEYGTYQFRIDRLDPAPTGLARPPQGDDIIALIDAFPNPLLAAGLFVVLDGARVDARLAHEFPGLAVDLDRLGRAYARRSVPAAADRTSEEVLEALFLLSIGRFAADELPARLRSTGRRLSTLLDRLRAPQADVYDSVRSMIALYGSLSLAAAVAAGELDGDAIAEMGGATVLDMLDYLEGSSETAPPGTGEAAADLPGPSPSPDERGADPLALELSEESPANGSGAIAISPEELRRLIEQGVELELAEAHGPAEAGLGMYITELLGKLPAETAERVREMLAAGDTPSIRAWLAELRGSQFHWYDEWDHVIGDYRHRWCRVAEQEIAGDGGRYFNRTMAAQADLVARIKREFLLMRPEQFRKVRGMQDGEDFDINALVDAHADRRTRKTPTDRLYVARRREERDVATLFLIDMSASTDEPLSGTKNDAEPRRVIDVTKDTLAVLAAVLEEIGDAYAMFGFSGHGREGVEYYHVKSFNERLGPTVRARLGGIEPKRSTRMGAALRHSAAKLAAATARARHLILLSDGFPQDHDYGEDRRSNVYGIRDTMIALRELESQGVSTFCITVDPAGHDYLGEMCAPARYTVIDDIEVLPEAMPRIYRSVTRY